MENKTKKIILGLGSGVLVITLLVLGLHFFLQPLPGRTNVLLLGIPGENHPGEDLADTIIFASIDNRTGKTLLLSLPRDIWIIPLRTKLNSIYHYQGMEKTKDVVSQILGQPVDYGVVIDFDLFTKIIDLFGGVTVGVERTFDDYKYPITGKEKDLCNGDPKYKCRYEHVHFEAGVQNMNGEMALKFVRSRNAEGEEGTDFARTRRQQKIILTIKDKILSLSFLLSPGKPLQLIKVITSNIKMDIPEEKYLDLFRIALKFRGKNLKMTVLNDGYLINPPTSKEKYDNQWVLVPKTGGWEEIQEYVKELLISNF